MRAIITPSRLSGSLAAVASKSEAHRILICAALAEGTTDIDCPTSSSDIDATADCLRALGARVTRTRRGFRVIPIPRAADGTRTPRPCMTLDCGESGSTLRFLLPVVCALGAETRFVGRGRLAERPLSPPTKSLWRTAPFFPRRDASPSPFRASLPQARLRSLETCHRST